MRIPLSWLRDFVDVPWGAKELGARLTMSGFELEALGYRGADVLAAWSSRRLSKPRRHPQAEKLQVCKVRAGADELLQIVCGAGECARRPQDRAGHRRREAAGRQGHHRRQAARRRIRSACCASAKELGLADASEGIVELPADAPVGQDLRAYMQLDDEILELNVTPNRGDAMSVLGIAREVAALTRKARDQAPPRRMPVPGTLKDTFPVKLGGARGLPEARQPRRSRHRQQEASRRCGCASACVAPACAPSARWSTSRST